LIKALRGAGRLDNAVLVLTSDHGENFGEWGSYFGHGVNVHDAAIRVPLIVAGAGIAKRKRVPAPLGLHDLAPTLLAVARVPRSAWPKMSGTDHSLAARRGSATAADASFAFAQSGGVLLRHDHTAIISGRPRTGYCVNDARYSLCWKGKSPPTLHDRSSDPLRRTDVRADHPSIYESLLQVRQHWRPADVRERSVSDGNFKLVERPRLQGGFTRSLYDLQHDPGETRDVQATHGEDLARLGAALDRWTATIPSHVRRELSADEEAQLKALGYVE
jgi:arylsulfatase A-like enzyme